MNDPILAFGETRGLKQNSYVELKYRVPLREVNRQTAVGQTINIFFKDWQSKLTRAIRKPKAIWVERMFYADVEYRDITSEGLLRASSFKGLTKGTRRT
jgi:hypothetical protein